MRRAAARQLGWYGLVLAASLRMINATSSAELLVDGVPIPDDVVIAPAPAAVPGPAKRFLGAWVGAWDDSLKHVLIVEEIRADGTARVVNAIGENPEIGLNRGVWRHDATISGETLAISQGSYVGTYILESDDTLTGIFQRGAVRSNARLSRIDLGELTRPDVKIAWSRRTVTFLDTSLSEDGKPVRLEVVIFKPSGAGPFPLLVINHGSTGRGNEPRLFRQTRWSFALADFLTRKGWLVAFPQRRGRGNSDSLYDEGFDPNRRNGYTCDQVRSLAGADRALEDVHAAMTALLAREDVDATRVIIGGISRGGVLSIAYAGQHPQSVRGVINFVGGWIGTGCGTASEINGALFRRGGAFGGPTIWLYGRDDLFYPIGHSRSNFEIFVSAGGRGDFFEFDVPSEKNGHALNAYPELWTGYVEKFLRAIEAAERKP